MKRDTELPLVEQFMKPKVFSLAADMPIDDALRALHATGFSGAPVLDGTRCVGVLSEVDGTRALAAAAFSGGLVGLVRDHMTSPVDAISPTDELFAVTQRLLASGHRRLPVVDDGRLVGLVTLRDVGAALRAVCDRPVHDDRPPPGAAWDPQKSAERDRRRGS